MKTIFKTVIFVILILVPISGLVYGQNSFDKKAYERVVDALELDGDYDFVIENTLNLREKLGGTNLQLQRLLVEAYHEKQEWVRAKAELDTYMEIRASLKRGEIPDGCVLFPEEEVPELTPLERSYLLSLISVLKEKALASQKENDLPSVAVSQTNKADVAAQEPVAPTQEPVGLKQASSLPEQSLLQAEIRDALNAIELESGDTVASDTYSTRYQSDPNVYEPGQTWNTSRSIEFIATEYHDITRYRLVTVNKLTGKKERIATQVRVSENYESKIIFTLSNVARVSICKAEWNDTFQGYEVKHHYASDSTLSYNWLYYDWRSFLTNARRYLLLELRRPMPHVTHHSGTDSDDLWVEEDINEMFDMIGMPIRNDINAGTLQEKVDRINELLPLLHAYWPSPRMIYE